MTKRFIFREDEYLVNMQQTVIPSWYQREGYIQALANLCNYLESISLYFKLNSSGLVQLFGEHLILFQVLNFVYTSQA